MPTLTLDLKIPLNPRGIFRVPAFTFSAWLPIGREKGITIGGNGIDVLLWFDKESVGLGTDVSEEDIARRRNLEPKYLLAEITVNEVDPDLASYIANRDLKQPVAEADKEIQERYDELAAKILETVLNRVNRLIAYARVIKGQYWLIEFEIDLDRLYTYFVSFHATARIENGQKFAFIPARERTLIIDPGRDLYIHEDEWDDISDFVASDRKTPLVSELLAGAKSLAAAGRSRSALTEAVTALEVATSIFAQSNPCKEKLASMYRKRIGVDSLYGQVRRIGLTDSINYLIPLLLPDSVLPEDVISVCQEAILVRQNVVHNGQREVPKVQHYLSKVEKFCEILDDYCAPDSDED